MNDSLITTAMEGVAQTVDTTPSWFIPILFVVIGVLAITSVYLGMKVANQKKYGNEIETKK